MTDQTTDQGKVHEPQYGKTPEILMHDLSITDGAVRLYSHMFWRYGSNHDNHEGHASMAKFMGCSETTISNRIELLEFNNWIVVVEIERSKKSGNYRTPFYHVFLDQDDCVKFRKDYKCQVGESIRPKPTEVIAKKSRKGKGGKPANILKYNEKNQTNSSSSDQTNSSWDGGTNSSLSGGANSSWCNPDVSDPDAIDLSNTNTSAAPIGTGFAESAPKIIPDVLVQADEVVAATAKTRDIVFDAVAQHIFGIDPLTVEKETGGRIGPIAAWLNGKSEGMKRAGGKVGKISTPAKAEHVIRFAQDYKRSNPGLSMPLDFIKFVESWRKWATKFHRPANTSTDPAHNLSIPVPVVPMLMQRNEELEPVV